MKEMKPWLKYNIKVKSEIIKGSQNLEILNQVSHACFIKVEPLTNLIIKYLIQCIILVFFNNLGKKEYKS